MGVLIVREPGCVAYSAPLPEGAFEIGREEGNQLVLGDRQVSRRHARITRGAGGFQVADLGSTHGIYVNGQRATERALGDGDVIQIGNALITFRAADDEPPPASRAAPTSPAPGGDAQTRRLRLLFEISRVIGATQNVDELAGRMLEMAVEVLGCERGLVGLTSAGAAGARRVARGRDAAELVVSRTHIDAMVGRRECVFVADALGAPLVAGGRVLGFVYLDNRGRSDGFGASDLDLVTALGHLTAAALAQAESAARQVDLVAALRAAQPADEMLGDSEPMRRLRTTIEQYARADAPVLILGETGSGKELVARQIHARSARAEGPFVPVNCAAIPETLLEAELFGHEKGAFTGALKARRGKLALAHGGTLFLDEIGDLSPAAQAKLLRALEDGEIVPLGAETPLRVDVRVLSATHRPLAEDVSAGRFREDLFYRLEVGVVEVPPLRARGEDLPLLARTFLERSAARLGKRLHFADAALAQLAAYDWPGNVRQLHNEVERAAILAHGEVIAELDPRGRGASTRSGRDPDDWDGLLRRRAELDDAERRILATVLGKHGGVIARAARELGLPRTSLASRLEALGLHGSE